MDEVKMPESADAPVWEDAMRDARTIYDIACIRTEYANATREDVEFKAIALRNYNFLAQQPAADPLVEWGNRSLNFTATMGVFKDGVQPAAVDEAMVDRLTRANGALTQLWESASAEQNKAEARAERLAEAGRRVTAAFRALGETTAWARAAEQARHECEAAMLALDAALEKEAK